MASTGKPAFKQTAFTGGEIAPDAQGRTDVERLRTGVNRCLNFIPLVSGGAITRPGTEYIGTTAAGARLIPFVFNEDQAYILEIKPRPTTTKGAGYIRFWRDGASIEDPNNPGNPLEVAAYWTAEQLTKLRYVQLNDIMWLTAQGAYPRELRRYDDDYWVIDFFGEDRKIQPPTNLAVSGWPTFTPSLVYPSHQWCYIVTSVDSLGNESLPSDTKVEANAYRYDPAAAASGNRASLTWTAPASGNSPVGYNIYGGPAQNGAFGWLAFRDGTTYVDEIQIPDYGNGPPQGRDPFEVGQDLTPGAIAEAAFGAISGGGGDTTGDEAQATKGNAAESYADKYTFEFETYTVYIDWVGQGTFVELNFNVDPDGGSGFTTVATVRYTGTSSEEGYVTRQHSIYIDGCDENAIFQIEINDKTAGSTALLSDAARVFWYSEIAAGTILPSYPNAVTLFEQRVVFGGFSENPSQLQASRTGDLRNFDVSEPSQDTDALDFLLASSKLNEVRAMLPLDALMVFTAGAEWIVRGTEGGAWTPTSFDFKPRSHNGISWCEPLLVGSSALIVVPQASSIREIRYDKEVNISSDKNLSILSQHLLRNYDLLQGSYQESPFNCAWWIRDDGAIIGLTYNKEFDIWGFHRHTTSGSFTSVATIPESENENKRMRSTLTTPAANADPRTTLSDFTYVIVERDIPGVDANNPVYYIERFSNRYAPDSKDLILADSALVWDGRGDYGTTVTASTATTWTMGSEITLTGSVDPTFFAGDVGSKYELTDNDPESDTYGSSYRFTITGFSSSQSITTTADQDVPTGLQSVATNVHGLAVNAVSGLGHLEAETVAVVIDGNQSGDKVVSSGAITTDSYGVRIQVGLAYNCELDTLNIHNMQDAGAGRIEQKIISRVGVEVDAWRGLYVGNEEDYLSEVMERSVADGFEAVNPVNTVIEVRPEDTWDMTKRVFIRQTKPLPCTVIAVIPEVSRDG